MRLERRTKGFVRLIARPVFTQDASKVFEGKTNLNMNLNWGPGILAGAPKHPRLETEPNSP